MSYTQAGTPRVPLTRMPRTYDPPLGVPLYWMFETSGLLRAAVQAYLGHGADPRQNPPPTSDQLVLIIDYCRYVIYAPCWRGPHVKALRRRIHRVTTEEALNRWIADCVEIGIDPL